MAPSRRELVEIDVSAIHTADELHRLLMDALDFPGYYGCNWDAFWDAIRGLVEMPIRLRILGWQALVERLPRDAELMQDCLDDLAERYPEAASEVEYI